jgi:tetratricopeptide (TPR) repeat protein
MRPLLSAVLGALLCAAPAAAQTLDDAVAEYLAGRYEQSSAMLETVIHADSGNVDAQVWMGEAQYRLESPNSALAWAQSALRLEPCHAAAHNLAATVHNLEPWDAASRDSTWAHARRAVECDPADGNAWLTYWISGLMRQDSAAQALAQRRIGELRFVPGPVMEMGRWILRSAPPNAVLFTHGDWDFFPIMVAQSQEGLRPDVTVAMRSMLEVPWYVRWLAARTGWLVPAELSLEGGDDWSPPEEFAGELGNIAGVLWAQGTLDGARPLTIPVTATPDFVGDVAWIRWDGPVYSLVPWDQAPQDSVATINMDAFPATMRNVDITRLNGAVVHPTDRSPIRRTSTHPASTILLAVAYYGRQSLEAGRMDQARQALQWAAALIATGALTDEDAAHVAEFRAVVEAGGTR